MKVVAFVPIKLNNERLPGKNIKSFDNGRPLISYILDTASNCTAIDETYVYCSNDAIIEYIPDRINYLKRPEWLDLSSTSITDVMALFTQAVEADVYVLIHATAPFISSNSIERGVNAIKLGQYDSALSVKKHQDFLWIDGKPVNYNAENIPRIQDIEPFYIETTGMYIFTRQLAVQKRRIGERPYLVDVSDIEAVDINNGADFEIANAVFNYIILKGDTKNATQQGEV